MLMYRCTVFRWKLYFFRLVVILIETSKISSYAVWESAETLLKLNSGCHYSYISDMGIWYCCTFRLRGNWVMNYAKWDFHSQLKWLVMVHVRRTYLSRVRESISFAFFMIFRATQEKKKKKARSHSVHERTKIGEWMIESNEIGNSELMYSLYGWVGG